MTNMEIYAYSMQDAQREAMAKVSELLVGGIGDDGDGGEHSAQELVDVIVGEGNHDKWPAWVLGLFANSGGLPVIDVEGAVAGLAAKRASE